jgi:hypothetical protein
MVFPSPTASARVCDGGSDLVPGALDRAGTASHRSGALADPEIGIRWRRLAEQALQNTVARVKSAEKYRGLNRYPPGGVETKRTPDRQ